MKRAYRRRPCVASMAAILANPAVPLAEPPLCVLALLDHGYRLDHIARLLPEITALAIALRGEWIDAIHAEADACGCGNG